MKLGFKIGKKKYFILDIVDVLSATTPYSKTELKRLFACGAIDMHVLPDEGEYAHIKRNENK